MPASSALDQRIDQAERLPLPLPLPLPSLKIIVESECMQQSTQSERGSERVREFCSKCYKQVCPILLAKPLESTYVFRFYMNCSKYAANVQFVCILHYISRASLIYTSTYPISCRFVNA